MIHGCRRQLSPLLESYGQRQGSQGLQGIRQPPRRRNSEGQVRSSHGIPQQAVPRLHQGKPLCRHFAHRICSIRLRQKQEDRYRSGKVKGRPNSRRKQQPITRKYAQSLAHARLCFLSRRTLQVLAGELFHDDFHGAVTPCATHNNQIMASIDIGIKPYRIR